MRAAKVTKIWSCWRVRKLPYKEVFERFANNLWSHWAQGFLLLRLSHIIKCSYLEGQWCSFDHVCKYCTHERLYFGINPRCMLLPFICSWYNVVLYCSRKLIASARRSRCTLLSELFSECAVTAFTTFGYNHLYGCKHQKLYNENVHLCADFIRDARMNPDMNKHLDSDIYCMSTL